MSLATRTALLTLALLPGPGCSADTPLPLEIRVAAREIAPGEPLRILVRSEVPLVELQAELRGQAVAMLDGGGGTRWSGWAMIGLDEPPGSAAVELAGRTAAGREALGTHSVEVVGKEFPTEDLAVAPRYVEPPPEVQDRLARERARLAAVYARRDAVASTGEPFARPVPGINTSVFGMRRLFNGTPRAPHPGLDLRAAEGTPVHCSGDGIVALAQELYYSGNTVIVDHGGGLFTLYAHLSRIDVEEGKRVARGDVVGLSGATGRVTGPHLHWGAKIGDRPFDPEALLDPRLFGR